MKNLYFSLIFITLSLITQAQPLPPSAVGPSTPVNWGMHTKSAADSCGVFFNNYIGLGKTSLLRVERMRVGNATESNNYNGRAQRFSAPQPIEISGIEFYSYIDNNPLVDSLMVVTTLNEFDAVGNTLGAELARDTVYVFHSSFDPSFNPVPAISVQSEFETPVTVNSDYMISVYTPTDDSLRIIANDLSVSDGAGEGIAYALYDNPNFPTFTGWYDMLIDFSADYDFLLSPKIAFKKQTGFVLSDTILCPGVDQVCLNYTPIAVQSLKQYNQNYDMWQDQIKIDWNDGNSNEDTITACHIYQNPGNYSVQLLDTISIWDFSNSDCTVEITKAIEVQDSIEIDFTYTQSLLEITFTTAATAVDSVWWDFGDNSAGSSVLNPIHTYPGPGTYNVWLYSFNNCMTKAKFTTITISANSIFENNPSNFTIYPNPANQTIYLSGAEDQTSISIYNIAGKLEYNSSNVNNSIDVSNLANGTYFVSAKANDKVTTKKITVRH